MTPAAARTLQVIGTVRSSLTDPDVAPKQGAEGAPNAVIELHPSALEGIVGLTVGDDVLIITWLHRAQRDVLQVHPRGDSSRPLTGVFATRSQDRPNPIGIHPVTVIEKRGGRLTVGPLEAIDGTPVIDIKPII